MAMVRLTDSNKGMGWGYYEIDPTFSGTDFRAPQGSKLAPTARRFVNLRKTYCLVGVEPDSMFRPGTEPEGFRWFWWDNSMMPHLRYPSASNPTGNKLWSRLTYCGWSIPERFTPRPSDRARVNDVLVHLSKGVIRDIAQLWGGCVDTSPLSKRHCLVIRSSERNYREFYGETWEQYWARIEPVLQKWGFTYEIRSKISVKGRIGNQITDQIARGGFDCVLANHSAGASEAVVTGTPVITTSKWNPARTVSTSWEQFEASGDVKKFTAEQIDRWVTGICAYTYYRTELNSLSWIDSHPDAHDLREARYAIY